VYLRKRCWASHWIEHDAAVAGRDTLAVDSRHRAVARFGCELARRGARVRPGFEGGRPTVCGAEGNDTSGRLRVVRSTRRDHLRLRLAPGAPPWHGGNYSCSPASSRFVRVLAASPRARAGRHRRTHTDGERATAHLSRGALAHPLMPGPWDANTRSRECVRMRRCNRPDARPADDVSWPCRV
jgi:hypothetical protein